MGPELPHDRNFQHPNCTTPPFQKNYGPIQWARDLGSLQTGRSPQGGRPTQGHTMAPTMNNDERPWLTTPKWSEQAELERGQGLELG